MVHPDIDCLLTNLPLIDLVKTQYGITITRNMLTKDVKTMKDACLPIKVVRHYQYNLYY